jgi:ribosomal-protein-alanine N-acetyltransferase
VFPHPWTEGIFREELAAPNRQYFVAEDDELAGYAGLMMIEGDAHVTNIAVVPEHRRRGIATKLMLEVVEAALAAGAQHLTLEVRVSNRDAQDLYRRFGLAPVGVRRGYYDGEDALIMWALDIDTPGYRERLDAIREGIG